MNPGDKFTIAGFYHLDKRWWPRLCNWLLRRPPPRTGELQQFICGASCGGEWAAEIRPGDVASKMGEEVDLP